MGESEIKEIFSRTLIALMKKNSMTEKKICEVTGISQAAINRIKNGHVCPNIHQAYLISKIFGLTIDDLTNDKRKKRSNYLPVLDLKNSNTKNIFGCIEINESEYSSEDTFAIYIDKEFKSTLLPEGSIVVIERCKNFNNGDTVLFKSDNLYKAGVIRNNSIFMIDDLKINYSFENTIIIGKVLKIQREFVKSKDVISQMKNSINKRLLDNIFDALCVKIA